MSDIGRLASDLLAAAAETCGDDSERKATLEAHRQRLGEPIRVALAGRVKAGKSTLLNAIIGEEVAPTDATECTRVVTWYRYGAAPSVTIFPKSGPPRPQPIRRVDGRLVIGTASLSQAEIDRIEVEWPSPVLETMTLIDTPGITSLSTDVSQRAKAFLTPVDSAPDADAVIYLLRHVHSADVDFLESFRERQVVEAGPSTTLGVLSRADEVGAGRIDALISAARIADAYRNETTVRSLCLDVVPVAGLLAQSARTLQQSEFDLLLRLSQLPRPERERLLLSADRFATTPVSQLEGVDPATRQQLLERFGVFGIRLGTSLIRVGYRDAPALAEQLARRSGLDEVIDLIQLQFTSRAEALKARSALVAARAVLEASDKQAAVDVLLAIDQALIQIHEIAEMRWLALLRSGRIDDLSEERRHEAERILGAAGTSADRRLGVRLNSVDDRCDLALRLVATWRRQEANPLRTQAGRTLCKVVIRSLETIVDQESTGQPVGGGVRSG